MKIVLYYDHYQGGKPEHAYATATPGDKHEWQTRYKVTFEVPDQNDPDFEVEAKCEEVVGDET